MTVSDKIFFTLISIFVLVAIGTTWYHFMVEKDYLFMVEAQCDPAENICFYRDCSTGECPPNELEYYQVFMVEANDFESCSDESCGTECRDGSIMCEEVVCDPEAEEDCTAIEDYAAPPEVFFPFEDAPEEDSIETTTGPQEEMDEIRQDATTTLETTI